MTVRYTRAPVADAHVRHPWLPVGIWAGVILVLSSMPREVFPRLELSLADLVLHGMVYAVLGVLVARALAVGGGEGWPAAAGSIVGALVFGALLEVIQGLVGRSPDMRDWAADGVGAGVGVSLRAAWNGFGGRSR